MLRVLSIDDHSIFRLGLVRLLSSDPRFAEVVGVSDAPSAQRWLSEHTADLILLDLALERGRGVRGGGALTTIIAPPPPPSPPQHRRGWGWAV